MATGTTWALVAARMGSTRLPGKALLDLAGKPALQRIIERLQRVKELDGICIATTTLPEDDPIAECAKGCGVSNYRRASPSDLLGRLVTAVHTYGVETVVYITADCPLVDPAIVERVLAEHHQAKADYTSNRLEGYVYPIGMDVEVFSANALHHANRETWEPRDREHVTTTFYERPWRWNLHGVDPVDAHVRGMRLPNPRLTLDTEEDLTVIRAIYDLLSEPFGLTEILELLNNRPDLERINSGVVQVAP